MSTLVQCRSTFRSASGTDWYHLDIETDDHDLVVAVTVALDRYGDYLIIVQGPRGRPASCDWLMRSETIDWFNARRDRWPTEAVDFIVEHLPFLHPNNQT